MASALHFHRQPGLEVTEPVFARPSSSVVLVRDGSNGLEMFLVRRHEQSGFANRAYVFPGGSVIASDTSNASISLSDSFTPENAASILQVRGDVTPDDPAECLSYWVAAARELLEEAGVLVHDDSRRPSLPEIAEARLQTLEAGDRFTDSMATLGVGLSLERLIYFSHWRTPVQSPKRYDTRFFIAAMPDGQEASHCGIETTDSLWLTPREALARGEGSDFRLVYPTRAHIARFLPYETVDELMEFARSKSIRCVDPIIAPDRSVSIHPEIVACW
jgi:8-oxo-dGTP pyrophosphatase MutT (NUDIX family)